MFNRNQSHVFPGRGLRSERGTPPGDPSLRSRPPVGDERPGPEFLYIGHPGEGGWFGFRGAWGSRWPNGKFSTLPQENDMVSPCRTFQGTFVSRLGLISSVVPQKKLVISCLIYFYTMPKVLPERPHLTQEWLAPQP